MHKPAPWQYNGKRRERKTTMTATTTTGIAHPRNFGLQLYCVCLYGYLTLPTAFSFPLRFGLFFSFAARAARTASRSS